MQPQKPQFKNLHNLLPTQESRIELSEITNIPLSKISKWLDPDNRVVPKVDSLIVMAKYFECSIDYLLDLTDKKIR